MIDTQISAPWIAGTPKSGFDIANAIGAMNENDEPRMNGTLNPVMNAYRTVARPIENRVLLTGIPTILGTIRIAVAQANRA
jgi:hypothetical protein